MRCRSEARFAALRWRVRGAALALAVPLLLSGAPAPAATDSHAPVASTYRDALAAGRKAMADGDLRRAEIEMRNAVKTYPNNPEVHALLAEIYLQLGNSPDAEEEARQARWHGGDDDEIAPVLAEAMLQQDKMSQLIHDVAPGQREMKAEATVRRALAEAHIALGETDIGEQLLKESRRLDPNSEATHVGLARLHMLQQDVPAAEQELAEAQKLNPNAIDVIRLEADLQRTKGDTAGALAMYDKAIGQRPDDVALLVGRAMLLVSLNRLEDAGQDVKHALDDAPYSLAPNFLQGLLLARQGDINDADDVLTNVSGAFDALPNGYLLLGSIKYAKRQYEQAIFFLARYVARRPDDLRARLILANSALRIGDPTRAISVLTPVAYGKATPDPRVISLLGQAYVATGRNNDAIELYQKEAEAKPEDPRQRTKEAVAELTLADPIGGETALAKIIESDDGLKEAGPIYVLNELRFGRLGSADQAAERLVATEKDNPTAQLMLSLVRMSELRYDDAENILRALAARDPNFIPAQYNLALLYRETGRYGEAKPIYAKLLQNNPTDQTSLRGMAETAVGEGNARDAEQWLKRAQSAAPNDPTPSMRLIEIEEHANNYPAAIATARALADRLPGAGTAQLLARTLARSGDFIAAAAALGRYLERNDGTPAIFLALAGYQHRIGNLDAANKSLRNVLAVDPLNEPAITGLVDLAFETGGVDVAVKTARSFGVRAPELSDLLAANALARAGRRDEAIASLKQDLLYHPSARNSGRLAELTWDAGKHDQAIAMLRDLAAKSDSVPVRLALANMERLEGNVDDAIVLYQQVLDKVPNELLALHSIAVLYEEKNDRRAFEPALEAYRMAPSPPAADVLGWAFVQRGDGAKALPFLEMAASALPNALEVQYHLAVALQGTGAVNRARSLLERITESKAPFNGRDDAQRRLEALQRG